MPIDSLKAIDVARQDRCFAFRWDGVTAALEERERGGEHSCLLRTLTNTRPTPATVVVRLEGGRVMRLVLLPFQKLGVYPPLAVAGGVQTMCGAFAVEAWQGEGRGGKRSVRRKIG